MNNILNLIQQEINKFESNPDKTAYYITELDKRVFISGMEYLGKVFEEYLEENKCYRCEHNLGYSVDCNLPSLTPCKRIYDE